MLLVPVLPLDLVLPAPAPAPHLFCPRKGVADADLFAEAEAEEATDLLDRPAAAEAAEAEVADTESHPVSLEAEDVDIAEEPTSIKESIKNQEPQSWC